MDRNMNNKFDINSIKIEKSYTRVPRPEFSTENHQNVYQAWLSNLNIISFNQLLYYY